MDVKKMKVQVRASRSMRGAAPRGGVRDRRGEDSRMGGCLKLCALIGTYRCASARFGRWMGARGCMCDTDEHMVCADVVRGA